MNQTIEVSVVYADTSGSLFERLLIVPRDATVGQAIMASDVLIAYPELAQLGLASLSAGVYSRRKKLDDGLYDGDRIEIYRPLIIDPKDRRRQVVNRGRDPKKWRRIRG